MNRSDDFLLREKLKDAFVHIAEGFSNLLNEGEAVVCFRCLNET